MHSFIQKLVAAFAAVALAAALASCGGGSSGSSVDDSSQIQGKGTVGILLTDKPADPAMFAAIIASIVKVELMGSEENGRVELFSAPPTKEFDLLRLRNESIPLAFKDNIPAGTYCKIRLTLSQLELVLTNGTPNDASDDTSAFPKLPGNGKLDLVVRDCFDVVAGEVLALQLDMDAGKSIHIVEKGNCTNKPDKCFNFRPVVFVDVIQKDFDSKLVRLSGLIQAVDSVQESLLLCKAIPSQDMDNEGCVKVHFGDESAFFDNVEYGGEPRAISELLSEDSPNNVGKELTVVGWVKSWKNTEYDDDKPVEYYPLLHLEALAAELGKFLQQVEGTVADDADSTGFDMTVSPGQVITTSPLTVMFQAGATQQINGTRIVSKSGILLQPDDVDKDLPVQVDGTVQLTPGGVLKAALVIVDRDALGTEQVTGIIDSIETDKLYLVPDEGVGTVCGMATNLLEVALASDLEILTVTITEKSSEIETGGTLMEGQAVGMNGICDVTDYKTDNVVIVNDQRK